MIKICSLFLGWLLDLLFGDPEKLPHPVVGFGRLIGFAEHQLNRGKYRRWKGAISSILLVLSTFALIWGIQTLLKSWALLVFNTLLIFFCLAGTTLIREVRAVFLAVDRSVEEGRKQVARIVGRDTSQLTEQEVRTAALETLAENLSDGVIAPLFWLMLLGVPGMMAYKMVNTLDSMIGYRTKRYKDYGCVAAHIDDVANYIPARLTAVLMLLAGCRLSLISKVWKFGKCHTSPNSGFPEAALAMMLGCRFGGPHTYFGEITDKPYIGTNNRPLATADMKRAVFINRVAEIMMVVIVGMVFFLFCT